MTGNRLHAQSAPLAKLRPPTQRDVVARGRLFEQLDEGRQRSLVWLSAPGGAGKTTLISSYLKDRGLTYIWYQLDEADADLATLIYYLTAAADQLSATGVERLPLYTAEYHASPEVFARNFFRQLFVLVPDDTVLVFDNYQEVAAYDAVQRVIRIAVQEAPEGCTLLVASRIDPPVEYARLRTAGQMALLDWDALRFQRDEIRAIAASRLSAETVGDAALERLYDYTEGWAAGLVLLLERMQHQPIAEGIAVRQTQEDIFNFFAGEIFDQTETQVQEFLLRTSFLSKFSAGMAAALTGNPRAEQILYDLTRRNFFTVQHGENIVSYEYHPLFRAFLNQRAAAMLAPDDLDSVRRTAAAFLMEDDQVDKAVPLLHAARDWKALVGLLLAQAETLVAQGRWQTLAEWIAQLPSEVVSSTPTLSYWLGICRLPFAPQQARVIFADAHQQFKRQNDIVAQARSWCGVIDSFVFEWASFKPLDGWIMEFFGELRPALSSLPSEVAGQVTCSAFMALMIRQPQHPEIGDWAAQAWEVAVNGPDPALRIKVGPHLLMYYTWWIGDLPKAGLLLDAVRPFTEGAQASPFVQTTWAAMAGAFYWMSAENLKCIATVDHGLTVAQASGVHAWDMLAYSQGVFATLSSGDLPRAKHYLDAMSGLQHASRPMDNAMFFYLSAWELHSRGEYQAARERVKTAVDMTEEAGNLFAAAIFWNDYGRTLYYCDDREAALTAVSHSQELGNRIGARTVEYLCHLVRAEIALLEEDEAACVEALHDCLAVGRRQGFKNHTWWDHEIMSRLSVKALEHDIETDYIVDLIRLRGLMPATPPRHLSNWPWRLKIHTLGRFALEIDGAPVDLSRAKQRKPLELLKALLAFGGKGVSEEQLSGALWPDAEGDAAHQAFATTLHRLRKLIGAETLVLHEGQLSLDERRSWLDAWSLEHMLVALDAPDMSGEDGLARLPALVDAILALYRGPFLGATDANWVLSPRERLRNRFLRFISRAGERLCDAGRWETAIACYQRGLEVDELAEAFYQGLMRSYQAVGRTADALKTLARCETVLARELGVAPSPRTLQMAADLRG